MFVCCQPAPASSAARSPITASRRSAPVVFAQHQQGRTPPPQWSSRRGRLDRLAGLGTGGRDAAGCAGQGRAAAPNQLGQPFTGKAASQTPAHIRCVRSLLISVGRTSLVAWAQDLSEWLLLEVRGTQDQVNMVATTDPTHSVVARPTVRYHPSVNWTFPVPSDDLPLHPPGDRQSVSRQMARAWGIRTTARASCRTRMSGGSAHGRYHREARCRVILRTSARRDSTGFPQRMRWPPRSGGHYGAALQPAT